MGIPFGGYKDFADCVKQNQDKDNPEAYCGQIQHQVEGGDKESDKTTNNNILYKRVHTPILFKMGTDPDTKLPVMWAYISSTLRDRDNDKFHKTVLETWASTINKGKINIGTDHGHSWEDSIGVWDNAEVRHNPLGDDLKSAKYYLFAKGRLEDPNLNYKVKLLTHKADIGEQISLSIAANPGAKNWYDLEVEKDGSNTRVIKSADLLKADVVGEPANPDARMIGIFLKHAKCNEGKCLPDCEGCYMEKDFAECIKKSMIAPNTHVNSSLVNENTNKNQMSEVVKDQADCPEGHKYNKESGKCEKEEMMEYSISADVAKFKEILDKLATTPAPQAGGDPNGTPMKGGLESIVQQALASMRTNVKPGDLSLNIPAAQIPVSPGVSGTSGAQPQTTGTPATPNLQTGIPIPPTSVTVSPGNSGTGPAPAGMQGTPTTPTLAAPSPMPPAQVQASNEPEITKVKIIEPKKGKSVLLSAKEVMKNIEESRKKITPKHENPGEILPTLIDTSKLTGDIKKHAEAYNAEITKAQAAQVRTIYTPTDLVEKSERGELLKELDENNQFPKVVKAMVKNKVEKKIIGSLLLTKAT